MENRMAVTVLANHSIAPAIIDMIKDSRQFVDLITPYIQLPGHLSSAIKDARKRRVRVRLFFRMDMQVKYTEMLESLMQLGVEVLAVDKLHAKIYRNENYAIVTSMNLYQYSTENSEEVAIVSDAGSYLRGLEDYVNQLQGNAINLNKTQRGKKVMKNLGGAVNAVASRVSEAFSNELKGPGHCIRCNTEVKMDPNYPLCNKCFRLWNKYGDENYTEKYCFICGKNHKTSVAKPFCLQCFRKHVEYE
jgi:phosphatidylserine/phosphatidylglycerophosphate/cardiolipin synthase-like enzyme